MGIGAEWYWRRATAEGGPITWDRLQSLAAAGKLGPRDFVRRVDWTTWKLASQVDEQDDVHTDEQSPDHSEHDEADFGLHGEDETPPTLANLPPLPGMTGGAPRLGLSPIVNPSSRGAASMLLTSLGPPPVPTTSAEAQSQPVTSSSRVHEARDTRDRRGADEHEEAPAPPLPTYTGAFPFRAEQPRLAEPECNHGLAVGALVTSLVGLVFLALPMGAVALGLAGWSLMTLAAGDARGKRLALMGLALGALDVGAWLVHMVVQVNATTGA